MAHLKDYGLRLILLFTASLLSVLNTVSLPTFATFDVARASFNGTLGGVKELRLGPWSFCLFLLNESAEPCDAFSPCNNHLAGDLQTCSNRHYGYSVLILSPRNQLQLVNIGSSWTRGLATHAAAAGATLLSFALLLSRQANHFMTLVAFVTTLVAFVSDIVFYFHVRNILGAVQSIGVDVVANTGPGFWISIAIFCLVVAESSASEGDLRLRRMKEALFKRKRPAFDLTDVQQEERGSRTGHPIVPGKDLCHECLICRESISEIDLRAVPCRETHIFCRHCIEAHLRRSMYCPCCLSGVPIYKEDLHMVVVILQTS